MKSFQHFGSGWHMFRALALCLWAVPVWAFSAGVTPEQPTGGEGFLVSVAGEPGAAYTVEYRGKRYALYGAGEGRWEIHLPVGMKDSGRRTVTVRGSRPGVRVLTVEVLPRQKTMEHLDDAEERMRDRQPILGDQHGIVRSRLAVRSRERSWAEGFVFPLESYRFSTCFAYHRKGKSYSYYHKGIDFLAPVGTPVNAIAGGRVVLSRRGFNAYGDILVVDHGQGVTSCYFHLSRFHKQAGDIVKKGELIGEVGDTGWASAPHLHLGVYLQGEPVDPLWWIGSRERTPPSEYVAR